MSKYFCKLDIHIDTDNYSLEGEELKKLHVYNKRQTCGQRAISQFDNYEDVPAHTFVASIEDESRLLQYVPQELLDIERPELWVMNISPESCNSYLPAHRDKTRLCSINFYFDTHGEETTYYELSEGKLVRADSFVAKNGEVWLLNSDEIHDVKLTMPHVRKSIGFSFLNTSYDTAKEIYERSLQAKHKN